MGVDKDIKILKIKDKRQKTEAGLYWKPERGGLPGTGDAGL
jgi:hypothetical protein